MNIEQAYNFFEPLWSDVTDHDSFGKMKPLLAHYSSVEVVEAILKNNEMWLSNPLFMNDHEEIRFGIDQGVPLILKSQEITNAFETAERNDIFLNAFTSYYSSFANQEVIDVYILSFCAHNPKDYDGILSMWRGYGSNGNGAAIIFDSAKIKEKEGVTPLILSRVNYASVQERIDWINALIRLFAKIVSAAKLPNEMISVSAYALFDRLKMFALYTKHHGFSEEAEWRLTYFKERDPEGKLFPMMSYHIGPRGVEPKLKLKIGPIAGVTDDDLSMTKILERIILGPTISSPLAQASFKKLLEGIGCPQFKDKVFASSIPFRVSQGKL